MNIRRVRENLHWWVTGLLVVAVVPAFSLAKLPLHIDLSAFLAGYWIGETARSVLGAVILYVVTFPLRRTLLPVWNRYRSEKRRFVFAALFADRGLVLCFTLALAAQTTSQTPLLPRQNPASMASSDLAGSSFWV